MNAERFALFAATYRAALARAMTEHPDDYMRGTSADVVADRMLEAVQRGSFNKDGRAFKAACKELGVPHTYKGIRAYLAGE